MQSIPDTESAPVLRTDFSDQRAWEKIRALIQQPVGILRFRANVSFIDDAQYANLTKEQLLELVSAEYNHSFIMIVDRAAIAHPEHAILILDLFEDPAREFRAIPARIQGIENNLSIGNMDFEDFAEAVDADGVFRGFPEDRLNPLLA